MKISFRCEAQKELDEALAYYKEANREVLSNFVREFRIVLRRISQSPNLYPYYEKPYRGALLRKFPYLVLYEVMDKRVDIVVVAHTSRKYGYWRNRD